VKIIQIFLEKVNAKALSTRTDEEVLSRCRHAAQHITRENTTHHLKHICASGNLYINNISNNRRQQFPRPIIGRNM
jgi:hypothetical protein